MAYKPKGFDRDTARRIRQVHYEQTGEWYAPSDASLIERQGQQGFITDPSGQRRYDELGRPFRGVGVYDEETGRFTSKPVAPLFNPKRFEGDVVYGPDGQVLSEEEIEIAGVNTLPAELTELPTSSSNASRPRTLAAGWHREVGSNFQSRDERLGRLTVMFRDGTLYNYYDVSYAEWLKFKGTLSKGPMLNRRSASQASDGFLLTHPHGPANVSDVPKEIQTLLAKVSRDAQLRFATTNRARAGYKTGDKRRKGTQKDTATPYVPLSAARKSGLNPNRRRGSNPATANQQKKR
jgi:cation transport regulator ChaB